MGAMGCPRLSGNVSCVGFRGGASRSGPEAGCGWGPHQRKQASGLTPSPCKGCNSAGCSSYGFVCSLASTCWRRGQGPSCSRAPRVSQGVGQGWPVLDLFPSPPSLHGCPLGPSSPGLLAYRSAGSGGTMPVNSPGYRLLSKELWPLYTNLTMDIYPLIPEAPRLTGFWSLEKNPLNHPT